MSIMRGQQKTLSILGVPLATLVLTSCHTLGPVRQPGEFIPRNNPSVVYVTAEDNGETVAMAVSSPRVRGDSLFGTWAEAGETVAMPLDKVQLMLAVQKDKRKVTMLVVGLSAAAVLGTYAVLHASGTPGGPHCIVVGGGADEMCD